ncbi:transforming growth factor-beta-induced protein ig-h3 [Aplysia californica]|uniref:Transforming growth factor-beta-induced protein ig-h3 n=1 Tax=Aplysia californica TaxID=6500 RepID=A0ABM1A5V0_APLCA|nr:transforming growth factor-beta-induced protein ig-h3 [Aplysia californica]
MTLFAPTDEALAKVPAQDLAALTADPQKLAQVLSYHAVGDTAFKVRGRTNDKVLTAVSGQPVRVNLYNILHVASAEGVKITERDIHVDNGYVQGIDGIMVPPEGDIVDLVTKRSDMKTLGLLLSKAGLIDVIKDTLLYHVVNRLTLYSVGMRDSMTFTTADRKHDRVMLIDDGSGDIFLNHAKVTEKDISATNGVIHVLDEVLVPISVLLKIEEAGLSLVG